MSERYPVSESAHHAAMVFICLTVPLLSLTLATLTTRIALKRKSGLHLGWDDGLIVAGGLLASIDWALLLAALLPYVPPGSTATIAMTMQTIKLGVVSNAMWCITMTCVKASVVCLLLRFPQSAPWRVVLYAVIGMVIVSSGGSFIFTLLQCRPIAATWDLSIVGAKCVGPRWVQVVSNITSSVNIATDVILSLFPLTFIRKLRRPFLEKILVSILMAMGITASAASIVKAVLIRQWGNPTADPYALGFNMSTWTCVELFLGITAACLPSLKPAVQRALAYFGIDLGFPYTHSIFHSMDPVFPPIDSR